LTVRIPRFDPIFGTAVMLDFPLYGEMQYRIQQEQFLKSNLKAHSMRPALHEAETEAIKLASMP